MSWIETAIEIAGSAFNRYDDPEEAIRHIRYRVKRCPDAVLWDRVQDTIEDALVNDPDIYNKAHEQIAKMLAFWIIYIRAMEHYKYMKEE